VGNSVRNLFSKDDWRLALGDEPEPYGPEVTFVSFTFLLACGAEGLAGAGASPNRSVWVPTGKLEGERPACDAAEPMTLDEVCNVVGGDLLDRSFIYFSVRYELRLYEITDPLTYKRIGIVVIGPLHCCHSRKEVAL
jgi:hypothetical protein